MLPRGLSGARVPATDQLPAPPRQTLWKGIQDLTLRQARFLAGRDLEILPAIRSAEVVRSWPTIPPTKPLTGSRALGLGLDPELGFLSVGKLARPSNSVRWLYLHVSMSITPRDFVAST